MVYLCGAVLLLFSRAKLPPTASNALIPSRLQTVAAAAFFGTIKGGASWRQPRRAGTIRRQPPLDPPGRKAPVIPIASPGVVRRSRLALSAAALALLALPAAAETTLHIGVLGAVSDAGFFIADKKGYFAEQGIAVDLAAFKEASEMTAPLAAGQLDVGAGAPSAGLYNAVARGIDIRIVADKGSMPPLYGYMPLIVRKDLINSGRFKGVKDLKGLRVGSQSPGGSATATLERALALGGLSLGDVDIAYMGHPQLALAITNHAIDAAFITEPNATNALRLGEAVRFLRGDEVYPGQQLAVVLYAGSFVKAAPELAHKFMVAYVKAARDYNDALSDGRLAGPRAEEIIAILTASTAVKDPAVYRAIIPHGCNPDGKVDVASLKQDLAFFRSAGLIKGDVSVEQALDPSFAAAAVATLGPYRPAR
jgi:NitT/TauT family transport system substrate-binding protein